MHCFHYCHESIATNTYIWSYRHDELHNENVNYLLSCVLYELVHLFEEVITYKECTEKYHTWIKYKKEMSLGSVSIWNGNAHACTMYT